MNDNVRCNFITRARIISYVRRFFDEQGFLEVSGEGLCVCITAQWYHVVALMTYFICTSCISVCRSF